MDERDAKILQAISDGLGPKTIAQKFGIHHSSVYRALERVLSTLGAKSISHAVKLAAQRGLLQ